MDNLFTIFSYKNGEIIEDKIPPSNSIDMYMQTCPRDHSSGPSLPFNEENASNDMEILVTSDAMEGILK